MAEEVVLRSPRPRLLPLPLTEGRMARLAREGDERAFAAIFERYHQELYRYCWALLRDRDEAEDALQATMASAIRALPGESREIALRPWLYRVAHNECMTLLRRRGTQRADSEEDHPAAPGADVEAERRQRLRELVGDLEALPGRLRSALVMRELSGLRHEEIAAALGTSAGAARQAVYEARVALLELSEGREMDCADARRKLSDRDGRVLRGRKLRAHLRSCRGCRDFRDAIATRRADLAALAPPLPAAAGAGLGAALLGTGATGGVAAGLSKASLLAASAALGLGAAGIGGSLALDRPAEPKPAAAGEERTAGHGAGAGERSGDRAGAAAEAGRAARAAERGHSRGAGAALGRRDEQRGAGAANAAPQAAGGASASARANQGRPAQPPGSALAEQRSSGRSTTPTPGEGAGRAPAAETKPAPAKSVAPAVGDVGPATQPAPKRASQAPTTPGSP